MQLQTEIHGDVLVAHTPLELADDLAAAFARQVGEYVAAGRCRLVFRMDRTERLDGPGLTALLDLRDAAGAAGGRTAACGLSDVSRDIFAVTRLDRRIETFDDLIDAVNAVR